MTLYSEYEQHNCNHSNNSCHLAATLVVGVTLATTQSTQSAFAYPQKKRGQDDSKDGNTVTIQACKQEGQ